MKKKEKKRIFSINNFYKHPVSMLITILAITLFFATSVLFLKMILPESVQKKLPTFSEKMYRF